MQKSLHSEKEEIRILKKRVDYLERINQQYISTLDTLNSLGDIHGNVEVKRSPEHIFTSTRQYLFRLARFDMTAFLMVDEVNNSFEITDCTPVNSRDDMQGLVDELINRGEFGWALNQNRICEPQLRSDGRRILLHVLASRTRIRGMFIGVLGADEEFPSIMTLGLISAILYNSAYALESSLLYKMISHQNEMLEGQVDTRTKELYKTQKALQKSNEELEERVRVRTAELSSANKKLMEEIEVRKKIEDDLLKSEDELIKARQIAEGANHAKSDFLSKMSHELRTPLNAILGFTQVMELDEALMGGTVGNYVAEISTAGEHLLSLINEVLDLTKIESGNIDLNLENINLADVIRECMALMRPLAKKSKVKLSFDNDALTDIYLYVDRTLFKQVIINLLSNGIKYNIEDGEIEIKATHVNNRVRVYVADTGLGIREDKKQYVFQPFNRLGAESTSIEGTGIGLVITRHLVNLMNGVISYESEYGKGTVFQVELDSGFAVNKSDHTDKTRATAEVSENIRDFTVLYIEDTPSNIRVVESILAKWSQIKLVSACSAEQGIVFASDCMPDVILMDVNLPYMSGIEAVSLMKADEKLNQIPVIAVSADAMQSSIKQALEAGFDRYLTKPVRMNELLTVLGQMTQQKLLN